MISTVVYNRALTTTLAPYARGIEFFLNKVIVLLLLLVVALWASQGLDLQLGKINLRISHLHVSGSLGCVLICLCVARMLLGYFVFGFTPADLRKLTTVLKRAIELGVLVSIVTIFNNLAGFNNLPDALSEATLSETASVNEDVARLLLLLLVRLVSGRHINPLLIVVSSTLTLIVSLYLVDAFLRYREQRAMNDHYRALYGEQIQINGQSSGFDPLRNDYNEWTWGHPVVNNKLGFRETDFEVPKPPGVYRIMVLGDSLTWGAGLAAAERYTNQLEAQLRSLRPEIDWEVVNFGRSGASTIREAQLMKKHASRTEPDLVILGFSLNDPQPRGQNFSFERARFFPLHNLIASLRHLHLHYARHLLHEKVDALLQHMGWIPGWIDALDRTYRPDSIAWLSFETALCRIGRKTREVGAGQPIFALLAQELASDRPYHPAFSRWYDRAAAAASAAGFKVVDTRSRLISDVKLADTFVNPFDGHPSVMLNRIYALELTKEILGIDINKDALD